ncbi:membrane protein [Planobispora rosea]|uniref:Membrane protein n=1 Tax=Planobispora rosea TaxID=35762 RepID=A0A8J3RZY0_PLARO|nr:membrane protein [Planobispora rosea]GIH84330.1 membrane protein [Planobispora rosea]
MLDALLGVAPVTLLIGLAVWSWGPPDDPARRLHQVCSRLPDASGTAAGLGVPVRGEMEETGKRRAGRGETGLGAAVGLMAFLLVGGPAGAVLGVIGSMVTVLILRRREPPASRAERGRLTADLPLAADLMVACLRAGQPITGALDVTVQAIGGPLGDRLAWVNGQLRLGAAPESAWSTLAGEPALAPLARTMSRAALSGAPVADVLTRVADDSRQAARAMSAAAAQRVGVQVVAPLGLCFLPAFVLLGIVPVVAGLAGQVMLP